MGRWDMWWYLYKDVSNIIQVNSLDVFLLLQSSPVSDPNIKPCDAVQP